MSYLQINDVTYRYENGFCAVENLSLNVDKGEVIALVGQNGAGKTTTAKMINGLLKPTKGSITIDQQDIKALTTAQVAPMVGYVFQNPDDQIFHDNVYEEIAFGPKCLKQDAETRKTNVKKAIELCGLTDLINLHPYELPYSSRKFVTIASIIAMDTDVIILDEPTAGQDTAAIDRLVKIISALKNIGKTVIVITHDMDFVIANFERAIVMTNKQKVYDGEPKAMFADGELLTKSNLEVPAIMQLAKRLGVEEVVTNEVELLNAIKELGLING